MSPSPSSWPLSKSSHGLPGLPSDSHSHCRCHWPSPPPALVWPLMLRVFCVHSSAWLSRRAECAPWEQDVGNFHCLFHSLTALANRPRCMLVSRSYPVVQESTQNWLAFHALGTARARKPCWSRLPDDEQVLNWCPWACLSLPCALDHSRPQRTHRSPVQGGGGVVAILSTHYPQPEILLGAPHFPFCLPTGNRILLLGVLRNATRVFEWGWLSGCNFIPSLTNIYSFWPWNSIKATFLKDLTSC